MFTKPTDIFFYSCSEVSATSRDWIESLTLLNASERVLSVWRVEKTLVETRGPGPRSHLKVALAFPDVVLQQEVIFQREAAVLIVQLRQEVVEKDGGERNVVGSVLPRWEIHTLDAGAVLHRQNHRCPPRGSY